MTNRKPRIDTAIFRTYEKRFAQGVQLFEQGLTRIFLRAADKIDKGEYADIHAYGDNVPNRTVALAEDVAKLLQDRDSLQQALDDRKYVDFIKINNDAKVRVVNPPTEAERQQIILRAIQVLDGEIQFHGLRAVFQQGVYELNNSHEAEFLAENPKKKISDVEAGQWENIAFTRQWRKNGIDAVHLVRLETGVQKDKDAISSTYLGSVEYAQILTGLSALKKGGGRNHGWIPVPK